MIVVISSNARAWQRADPLLWLETKISVASAPTQLVLKLNIGFGGDFGPELVRGLQKCEVVYQEQILKRLQRIMSS